MYELYGYAVDMRKILHILNTFVGKCRLENSTFKITQNKSQMTPYGNI